MTAFIMPGELREKLGFDGYAEALRRRWLLADSEQSGMVQVTNNLNVVEEIRQIAECEPVAKSPGTVKYGEPVMGNNPVEYPSGNATEQKMGTEAPKSDDQGETVKKAFTGAGEGNTGEVVAKSPGDVSYKNEAARYALAHAGRRHLNEFIAPATGKVGAQVTAATPVTTNQNLPKEANVGDRVIVASEGQTYTATVAKKSPDGTYNLSFGQGGPRDQARPYRSTEFKVAGVAAPAA